MEYGYIYKITNPIGQIYIGQTGDFEKRKSDYKYLTKISGQKLMYKSVKHYGWFSHRMDIIYRCTLEQLDECEIKLIKEYNSRYYDNKIYGLNLNTGGGSNRGGTISEETRQKMSESQKKRTNSPEYKKILSERMKGNTYWKYQEVNPFKGRYHSEETKDINRSTHLGKKMSEDTRYKMSLATEGENNGFYGKHHTEETKRKMSEAKTGKSATWSTKRIIVEDIVDYSSFIFDSKTLAEEHFGVTLKYPLYKGTVFHKRYKVRYYEDSDN